MRINSNQNVNSNPKQLHQNKRFPTDKSNNLAKTLEKITNEYGNVTGYMANKIANDASWMEVSKKMLSKIGKIQMDIQDDISLVQTADKSLSDVGSALEKMKDMSASKDDETSKQDDKGELQKEFNNLKEEINKVAKTTNFQQIPLLDGTQEKNEDDDEKNSFYIDDMSSYSLGIEEIDIYSEDAQEAIENAINIINDQKEKISYLNSELVHEMDTISIGKENLIASNSVIDSAEYAREILNSTKENIFSPQSLAMYAHTSQHNGGMMYLLK